MVMVIKDLLLIKSNDRVNPQVNMFDFTLTCAPGEITLAPSITGFFCFVFFKVYPYLVRCIKRSASVNAPPSDAVSESQHFTVALEIHTKCR